MTPEELIDSMANKAEFDDAYIQDTAKQFAALDMDGMRRFMTCFNERRTAFTPEQTANIQKINLALAKTEDFNKALRSFHDWKMANAPKAEDGP